MGADGRELLQGQADVSPRVPRMDLRRPLEGERQHAELHVADDPVGGPVVDRRPPPTGAPPPNYRSLSDVSWISSLHIG